MMGWLAIRSAAAARMRVGCGVVFGSLMLVAGPAMMEAQQSALPLIVADFNHDGIPDVLVPAGPNSPSGQMIAPTATIAFGSVPYGTFSGNSKGVAFPGACVSFSILAVKQGQILVGDFNGDGLPDIYFSCYTNSGQTSSMSGVMLGNGDGTFGTAIALSSTAISEAVVGDFNHDGKLDIATIQPVPNAATVEIGFYSGNGDGTFAAAVNTVVGIAKDANSTQALIQSVVAADVDGDGYPDLVAVSIGSSTGPIALNVFGNNKDGTFGTVAQGVGAPSAAVTLGVYPSVVAFSVRSANVYGSGRPDFVIGDSGSAPGIFVVKNTSSAGSFSLGTPAKTAYAGTVFVQVGNFTGTAFSDIAVTNGTSVAVLANDGSGNYTGSYAALNSTTLPAEQYAPPFAVADANGDGYSDLYTATTNTAGGLQLAVNLVSGTATATSQPFSLGIGSKAISANWPGNVNFLGSTATGTQIVNGVGSATAIVSSKNPSTVGDAVTLTVHVVPAVGTAIPTGIVSLTDGGSPLMSGTLDGTGRFAYTTSALAQGTHVIQASYMGDQNFAGSLSQTLMQVVNHAVSVTPTLTWATPAPIVYGTALSGTQLDAVAADANGVLLAGTFNYQPAAGTVLSAGQQMLSVSFTPNDPTYVSVNGATSIKVTQAVPVLTWATPASIAYGIPLGAQQLNAVVSGVTGSALPGVLTYTPAAGTVPTPGMQTLNVNFVPTDALDYVNASGSVKLTVTGVTLTSITPNTAIFGDGDKTVTLVGAGFVTNSVVTVNGTAVATTLVNPTTLSAVIPAANFAKVGTLQVVVVDPAVSLMSSALTITVAPSTPSVTLGGPATSPPGSQPTLSFSINNPYPVALTAVFNLGFAPAVSPAVDDPAIQFASGGRTYTFVIPANSTAVPPIQLQAGTVAGTITIPLTLTAAGTNVTPTTLQPVVIVVPPAVPMVSTTSLTRDGTQLTVVMQGFSNTREVSQATFHFVGISGEQINTPDITLPVGTIFTGWYGSAQSDQYGSTFTYTQIFNVSDGAANIASVQVTLTNTVGVSALQTAQ